MASRVRDYGLLSRFGSRRTSLNGVLCSLQQVILFALDCRVFFVVHQEHLGETSLCIRLDIFKEHVLIFAVDEVTVDALPVADLRFGLDRLLQERRLRAFVR